MIHPSSDVQTAAIGDGTRVWQFCVVLPGARIGADVNVCSHVLIENDVVVGDRTTIKSGVQLWDGIRLGNDVFVGPNASFTNDPFPRSKQRPPSFLITTIEDGASIGAGAVILPGLTIGKNAMVGAGAIVTRSVPANAVVVGNPARIVSYAGATGAAATQVSAKPGPGAQALGVGASAIHSMPVFHDIRGSLTVGEFERSIPFPVRRYFMVFDVPSAETRGEHAHRECHQFLICVRGQCSVVVDDGESRAEVLLAGPTIGLHIPPMVWGIQYKYSKDAILLVFASHHYDAADYVRNYDDFRALASGRVAGAQQ